MITFVKFFPEYENQNFSPAKLSDGWAFATILKTATDFKINYSDLDQSNEKWTFKLSNLKKIIVKIEEYFEDVIKKGIKTTNIDLIEIAKNNNVM